MSVPRASGRDGSLRPSSAYRAVGAVVAAAVRVRLLFPMSLAGRTLWRERLGEWGPAASKAADGAGWLWIHAASVGEVRAAAGLIARLRAERTELRVLLTCNTPAGRTVAQGLRVDEIRYFPIDYAPIIRRVLDRVRPVAFVAIETELWPELLAELGRRGIRSAVVSASISDRSWPRYRRFAWLFRPGLFALALVGARDEESRSRFVSLGAVAARAEVTGDLKLDAVVADENGTGGDPLAELLDEGVPVPVTIVAVSTHPGEAVTLLDAYGLVLRRFPALRLIIAPRHPQRAKALFDELARRGLRFLRWTQREHAHPVAWQVLVLDTVGHARDFMRSACGAFVGGTFVAVGGHNALEPAAYGLPSVCGPQLDAIREQAARLVECGGLTVVRDAAELAAVWAGWLDDPTAAAAGGARAREYVVAAGGVADRTWSALKPLLDGPGRGARREP